MTYVKVIVELHCFVPPPLPRAVATFDLQDVRRAKTVFPSSLRKFVKRNM